MMRGALPAFALAIVLASGADAAPVRIVVNGQEIETSVIETNGAIYVPIDTLSKALGVTLTIKTNEAPPAVVVPPPPAPEPLATVPVAAPPPAPAPAPVVIATTTTVV